MLAPILIPTLDRYFHFVRCVESLKRCRLAKESDLYIAIDYPISEHQFENWSRIKKYASSIVGFNSTHIIEREENYGARSNAMDARKSIWEDHEDLIFSEDDNEFGEDFLVYLNSGLKVFRNDERVFGICAHVPPVSFPKKSPAVFLDSSISAWGWAGWREKYNSVDFSLETLKKYLADDDLMSSFGNKQAKRHAADNVRRCRITNDTAVSFHLHVNAMYCVFPKRTLVKNNCFDGTGVNCPDRPYSNFIELNRDFFSHSDYESLFRNAHLNEAASHLVSSFKSPYGWRSLSRRALDAVWSFFRKIKFAG